MSLGSNIGAETAAEEIATFVKKRLTDLGNGHPKAQEELRAVLALAERIIAAAKTGWY